MRLCEAFFQLSRADCIAIARPCQFSCFVSNSLNGTKFSFVGDFICELLDLVSKRWLAKKQVNATKDLLNDELTPFFFALESGRPDFWKIRSTLFLGPCTSN